MELSIKAFAVTFGVFWATLIFWSTLMAVVGSGSTAFQFFDHIYFGWLSPSFGGLIFGTILGFLDGLIGGALCAWIYNSFV